MKHLQLTITIALLACSSLALAKTPPGGNLPPDKLSRSLNGTVTDNFNKPVKDVSIKAVAEESKEHVLATSDMNGGYSLQLLKPGTYKLIFEKDGYKKIIKDKVKVGVKEIPNVDIEMPVLAPYSERGPSLWHFFDS